MAARPTPTLIFVFVLLVGLGVSLWIVARDEEAPPPVTEDPDGQSSEREEPTSLEPVAVGEARVAIRVLARRIQPRELPECVLVRGDDDVVPCAFEWIAGSAAGPDRRRGGPQLVRLELAGGESVYRVVRLPADGGPAVVRWEPAVEVGGRVVDEMGEAIANASVWLGGREAVTTDGAGRFSVAGVRSRTGLPMVIRAAGRASSFRVVDWVAASEAPEPIYRLDRGAELIVRAAGTLPDQGTVEVLVRPLGGADGSHDLTHTPFFWSEIEGARVLAADGTCRLRGLPDAVGLEVVLSHPELASQPVVVRTRAAPTSVDVRVAAATTVAGVVTRGDTPASGVLVVSGKGTGDLVPASRAELLLPLASQLAGRAFAITDEAGAFRVVTASEVSVLPDDAFGVEAVVSSEPVDVSLMGWSGEPVGLSLGASEPLQVTVVHGRSRRVLTLGTEEREFVDLDDAVHVEFSITRADGTTERRRLWLDGPRDVDL